MIVLIDNGHGDNTPGKRSPDGILREYKYTREIAAEVQRQLQERGYQAQLLVPEVNDIHWVHAVTVPTLCARISVQRT